MSDKVDNPPAFPGIAGELGHGHCTQSNVGGDPTWIDHNQGMTLRDYFAGIALGKWVQAHIDASVDDLDKETIARESYSYADHMLKARKP